LVDAVRIPSTQQASKDKVITRSRATRALWVEEEEEKEEEEDKTEDTMSVDSLSMDSNEPDFFNNRSDEIEKRIDDVDTVFDIEYPPKNEDKASNITMLPLSSVERAYLDFCVELLNQRVTQQEYDSTLVCAAAVLGVHEDSFRTPEDYLPILLRVIKIARFIVVKKAVELSNEPEEEEAAAKLPSSIDNID
jgi:hypothetical protein